MTERHLFSLNQAAKASGRSKSTISKALKSGRLSYATSDASGYQIEAAELFRVFPANAVSRTGADRRETPPANAENMALRAQLEAVERERDREREERERERRQYEATVDDLRRRLDAEGEERRKLTAMLTDGRKRERAWWHLWRA